MLLVLRVLAAVLAIVCFSSFGWAINRFFVSEKRKSPTVAVLSVAGLIFFIVQLAVLGVSPPTHLAWPLAAVGLYLLSLGLFWAAVEAARGAALPIAFSGMGPKRLVRSGPFRVIRHPFYASYSLFWSAGVVASARLVLLPTAVLMIAAYLRALRDEEARLLEGPLAAEYAEYREGTGALLPKLCC